MSDASGNADHDDQAMGGDEDAGDVIVEVEPTPEELAREQQERYRRKAQAVNFTLPGKTLVDVYKEARKIDIAYDHARVEHRWTDAYYTLHLYLELCMKRGLHRPTEARYEKEGSRVKANLMKLEARLETARKGMLWQLQNAAKQLPPVAVAAAAAAAAAVEALPRPAPVVAVIGAAAQPIDAYTARAALDALRLTPAPQSVSLPALALPITAPAVGTVVGDTAGQRDTPLQPIKLRGAMSAESSVTGEVITTMTLKRVAGDGSCAFRAIAQGQANGTLSAEEEFARARDLRALAVRLLRERGGEMMVGTGLTIEQVVLMKDGFESYDVYLDKMAHSEYAGETEFWLLAEELGIRISIFINGDDGLEHMITYGAGTSPPPICLLWQRGQQSDLGNHYDMLKIEA